MIVDIDGAELEFAKVFHRLLKESGAVPAFYGENLAAFWDALTGLIERPFKLVWRNVAISEVRLGADFERLGSLMAKAAKHDLDSGRLDRFEYELIP